MAITVHLYYTGKNGFAVRFAKEMIASGTVDKIKSEEGNLKYEYYIQMDDPEMVLLIDSWTSQAAIDLHHASPMMETIVKLREKYDLHMHIERYISDDDIPKQDIRFIRK